ncbi:hypothetical protein ACFX10_011952 [Malus domestica]
MEAGSSGKVGEGEGYKPPPEFSQVAKEPLVDINMNGSTELWLISWPKDQNPDFCQEVSLKLGTDGELGSFVGPSGKEYDLQSTAQKPDATVFVSSASGTKVAGKISRNVSLVFYPEPSELEEKLKSKQLKKIQQISAGMSRSPHSFATPTRSSMPTMSRTVGGLPTPTHSSRQISSISGVGEPSQLRKKRRAPEPTRSMNHSGQNSGRRSGVTD